VYPRTKAKPVKKTDDKLFVILEKLSGIGERTARMEAQNDHMRKDLETIKIEDGRQNQLLAEHIQGTVTNTERLNLEITARQELEKRVVKIEKPISVHKILTYVALVIGIVYEAGRIMKRW
jgi:hypothetical protein